MPRLSIEEIDELLELAYSIQAQTDNVYNLVKEALGGEIFTIDFEITSLMDDIDSLVTELEGISGEAHWKKLGADTEHPLSISEMIEKGRAIQQKITEGEALDKTYSIVTQTGLPQVYVKSVKAETKTKQIDGTWGGFTVIRPEQK